MDRNHVKIWILCLVAFLGMCVPSWAQENNAPVRALDSSFSASADTENATFVYVLMVANDYPCDVEVTLTCGLLDDDDNFIDGMTQTHTETLRSGEMRVITGTFVFPLKDLISYRYNFMGYKADCRLVEGCHETAI